MTDQTQRLEIATVKAEVGSNILSRFSSDAINAGGIPTESGDIKNLKVIIKEIEDKASVSTSIYTTVVAGLAATSEGGMFLVQSDEDDEVYVVWRKVGGVAVDTGKRALSSQAAKDSVNAAQASADAAEASALAAQEAAANSSRTVDSIAALKVLDSSNIQRATVIGYYAKGDGGGGEFYWDETALKSNHNGGTIISPTVPFTGTSAGVVEFLAGTGETLPVGFGCWRRVVESNVSALWFGAIADGVVDVSLPVDRAARAADQISRPMYLPTGTYRISTAIVPPKSGMHGDGTGSTHILCNGCSAILFPPNMNLSRRACLIDRMSFASVGATCDSLFAISAPGVASGAAPAYNSGITIADVEFTRFGGCFYFKDCFEVNVDRVIATLCTSVVKLVGSVVQSTFTKISSFADGAPRLINHYGFSTEVATYSVGVLTPEHITTQDCSFIRYEIGINHIAGLMVNFYDTDVETYSYGAYLLAPCTLRGGIFASSPNEGGWTGIYRGPADFEYANAVFIDDVEINTLNLPAYPGASYGVEVGNGSTPQVGTFLSRLRIRGRDNSLLNAIKSNLSGGVISIKDSVIRSEICSGDEVTIGGAESLVLENLICVGGTLVVGSTASTTSQGVIRGNVFSSISLSVGYPKNWSVSNNLGDSNLCPSQLFGSLAWSPTVANGAVAQATVSVPGARLGDPTFFSHTGLSGVPLILSSFVESPGVVRVLVQNLSGTGLTLSGTANVLVSRLS